MLDIETLRIIWWVLIGVLLIGFAVTDGFDLGVATLLPLVTKTDDERRIVLNTLGPVWEGNQVWIILGAGAIFAAWPFVYAVAFSGAYFAVLLLLLTMGISRPVSFKYRGKLPNMFWRRTWDWVVFVGGFVPAIVFGVLMGNILSGIPFNLDNTLRISYDGTLLDLFHPFALWCGLTSLFMLVMHGGLYLAIKTYHPIRDRALFWSRLSAMAFIICFAVGGFLIATQVAGYQITSGGDPFGYSNPLTKQVTTQVGAWMQNYSRYPITMLVPAVGFIGALLAMLTARLGTSRFAFICSGLSIAGVVGTVGLSMFPFILPSITNPSASLLVWDASSSPLTLLIMLVATIIFLPIILLYTAWVYRVMRGKVTTESVKENKSSY